MGEVDYRKAVPGKMRVLREWLEEHLDPKRVRSKAEQIYESARWSSTARLRELGKELSAQMLAHGFDEARVIEVASDGETHHGGWAMPLEWSPRRASLAITGSSGEELCRADYGDCPHHLVLFSAPTPGGGLTGELVLHAEGDVLEEVNGRFVLMETAPSIAESRQLMRAGALGFVTDFVSEIKGVKEGQAIEDAVAYLNYNIAPWVIPEGERAVGFAISPAQGRALREALAKGESLQANASADIEMGPGSIPVITGLVRGQSERTVILTAHIDEPGGVDNASGPAMILEWVRCLAELKRRDGELLQHGLRVFFSLEVRGLQALINEHPELFQNGICGLNIDMIGTDPLESKCAMLAAPAYPGCPDFVFPVLEQILNGLSGEQECFRWKKIFLVDDNNMGDPGLRIPVPAIVQGPDATYHTSLDTPDRLNPEWTRRLGAAFGSVVAGLADADGDLAKELLQLNYAYSVDCLKAAADRLRDEKASNAVAQLEYLLDRECRRLFSTLALDNSPSAPVPFVSDFNPSDSEELYRMNRSGSLKSYARDLDDSLRKLGSELVGSLLEGPAKESVGEADRLIPIKAFRGHFAADNLPQEQAEWLHDAIGQIGWCAPDWLQLALGLADGTRSVRQIHDALQAEGQAAAMPQLLKTFEVLEACAFARRNPFIDADELRAAFNRVGVRDGMLLVLHSSLSRFGYIAGGANALLEILMSALGNTGTLCTPTHTLSWAGNAPCNPETTPSLVGTVTNVFRQLPGVLRSQHPTHSVAARGPMAERLLEGHDKACAPLGRSGFWGHFVENDGWVLLMSPRNTNTVMHTAEIWGGVREPDVYLPAAGDAPMEVLPQIPWHVDWFDDIYSVLDARGSIRSTRLGHGTIELMRAREVVEIGLELIRENPNRVCPEACDCPWCRKVREAIG